MRIVVQIAAILAGTLGLGAAELDLAGTWRLSTPSATNVWDCAIPGDNASALLKAGFLRDPFLRGQEDCVQWLGNADWTFTRTFDAEELQKRDLGNRYLEFDSIDTVADVVLNGVKLGSVENEFRAWRFDVTKVLRPKGNVLEVRVKAPRKEAEARWLRTPDYDIRSWAVTQCREINCLRKCQCSFGWDWGCSLPVSGIYGGVRIVSCLQRLEQPWAESKLLDDGSAEITVHTGVSPVSSIGGVCIFNGETKRFRGDRAVFKLVKPELWWPNGMGAQKLYDWSVDFDGQIAKGRLGIRKLELVREQDADGESFGFRVNGKDFFTTGADWIPCDAFPARRTPERIRALLQSAAEANVNCVRVWGGGTYESAAFYEACDELGLLVWQDFMFACGRYPATDAFLAEIAAEAEHQVKRLRQYTSILLWCGDNECIGGVREKGRYQDDWIKWNSVLAEAVAKNAPGAIWWPSSPCAGPGDFTYNELTGDKGDTHYWGVWHGSRDLSGYRMINPRFVSEFGYQSLPSAMMVERSGGVIHQKNRGGNEKIDRMLEKLFPEPKDFPSRLYLSQVQQALAIETAVAYWKTLWPRCRGAVVWQLNDWWPVASWSSLEYDGRWKPLHYAMRRFFASDYDAKRRDAELRDLDFRTKDIPAANVRIASVTPRADGAFEVMVACDAKALFVWLENPSDPETRFDDNLVDLEAGGRVFVCRPGRPTTAETLKARLTVRDLSSSVKRVTSLEPAKVCVTASETEGGTLPNLSSMAVAWDGRRLKWTPNARYSVTNFVRYIELMTATGGNADRDMDEDFKPLLDLCRKALDYGLKPYLKLGNVPVRFTAGCDPRRKKQGGADGGSYGLNIRPPDDYEAYGRYMRSCAAALRDAFGRDEVRSWRFSVMTESNNPGGEGDSGWFAAKGGDNAATLDAFVRIYDVTAKAFEAELGDGLVFGTHLLDPGERWKSFGYEDVIARCRPLSLLPVSYYFGAPDGDQADRAAVFGGLGDVVRAAGKGVISGIDEGRVCFSRPGAKSKDLRTRTVGQSYQAAFNVRLAKTVLDAGGGYIASWGFFAGDDPLFAGVPTFDYFTAREIAKFAGMRRCAARTDGTPPEKEVMDAIAAVSPDGRTVRVAVSRLRDKLEFTEPYDTTVSVDLPAELKTAGRITVSELTLDDRNNWFVDWERERREKGIADADYWASPDDPNPLFSLADDSAKEFFNSRVSAYAAKADRIVPQVRSLSVPSDGVLTLPVSFRGNGAAFFELRGCAVTLDGLLDEMADPDANTYLDSVPWRGRLWSSYDRTLGNSDWSQYLQDETNADGRVEHVMMDAKGPGALVRLWTANGRDAYLRFYFDGSATPLFEGVGTNLIGGHVICPAPLSAALSPHAPLEHQAQNLYLPLPFAKSLKITVETPNEDKRFWYNAEVREYAAGTPVETVSGEILKRAGGKIENICAKLLSESVDASSGKRFTGTSLVLEGPATIRALALEAKGTDERNVRVKMCFDGVGTADVSLAQLKGLVKTALSMPFRRSCRIEFSSKVSGCVGVAPYRWDEDRSMHFHAKGLDFPKLPTRKEGVSHYDLNWAELTGRGRLVGNALLVGNDYLPPEKKGTWWGEGDEEVRVDGEDFPSYFGTGTEDFFGYAWGEATPYDHPFLKMPVSDRNVFRLRRLDSIPFDRSLKLDVEIWHNHTEPTFVDYSPATFWYARPETEGVSK